jgi:exodeoxyribonuclease VII large subunit
MSQEFFTVSEFNTLVRDVIASGFPRAIWVCGEIQNLDRYKSKAHLFFDLVEKDEGVKDIKAKAGVAIWAGVRTKIETTLKKAENAFELKDGIEVKFLCKVDYYPVYGTLRLIVENIDPVYTLGKIAQERQKLIAELTKIGILEKNKKLELSPVPLTIGLISAFDSAAYNDFLDELKQSGYGFRIRFVNAVMQGKACEASVAEALRVLNSLEGLDAIVITRGGGSIADLSAFDAKGITLAIAASRYPVLTGIGHEINISIADLAAHTFAKTPTAVAQFLAERVSLFMDRMAEGYLRVTDLVQKKLADDRERTRQLAVEAQRGILALLKDKHLAHARIINALEKAPVKIFLASRRDLLDEGAELKKIIQLRMKNAFTRIGNCQKIIEMASPVKTLKRGFSITRTKDGQLVRKASDVGMRERLVTEFAKGSVESEVKVVNKEE